VPRNDRADAWAQAASRLLPHGELAVVPASPHNANYSAADHLAELVLVFLRRQALPGAGSGRDCENA
jgi:hypothetical protein